MARRLVIQTVFSANNKVTKTMDSIRNRFSKVSNKMQTASKKTGSIMRGFLGSQLILGGLRKISTGIIAAKDQFIEFDQAITAAGAKFGNAFKRGTDGAERLRKVARKIGGETEFTATEAAKGLDFLALAGFNAAQSMALLPGVVDLATSSQQDLATSSDIASDALGAFNLTTEDSTQLTENFNRVMDVMAKTSTSTNTDLLTLFESIKAGAPTFTATGQSLESFNALVGVMANAGVKGGRSGTILRNMMLRLANPVGKAKDIIKELGIEVSDENGNFRDIIDIIGDFEKKTKDMGEVQKAAALDIIFGKKAIAGINILMNEGSDELRAFRTELENASGSSKALADEMRLSLQNQLKKITSGLTETGFKLFDVFGRIIQKAIRNVSKFVDKMNAFLEANKELIQSKIDKFFKFMLAVFIKISPIVQKITGFFGTLIRKFIEFSKTGTALRIIATTMEIIANSVNFIVNLATDMISTFIELGETTGLFDALARVWETIGGVLDTVFVAITGVWETMKDTGVLKTMISLFTFLLNVFSLIFKLLSPLIKMFAGLFKIYLIVFSPIIKLLGMLFDNANKLFDLFDKKKGKFEAEASFKSDDPLSADARRNQANVETSKTITTIEKSLLEIKGVDIPENLSLDLKGNLRKFSMDPGLAK